MTKPLTYLCKSLSIDEIIIICLDLHVKINRMRLINVPKTGTNLKRNLYSVKGKSSEPVIVIEISKLLLALNH